MKKTLIILSQLTLAMLPVQSVWAQSQASAKEMSAKAIKDSENRQTYAYAFKDADVAQVAEEILGHGLGIAYRVDPGVTAKMNFRIEQRLTKAQLLAAFEGALASQDIAMTNENDAIVIRPREKGAMGGHISVGTEKPRGIGVQVRAVPIKFGSASEIAKILSSLSKSDIVLMSSDKLSLILLAGRGEEIDEALSSIELFDQSALSDARIRFYPLSNASAATVSQDLDKLIKDSGASNITIVPMVRLNGLFAFSRSKEALDELGPWVQKLDIPSNDQAIKVFVYHPKGASAEALADTLNQALGLSSMRQATTQNTTSQTSLQTTSGFSSSQNSMGAMGASSLPGMSNTTSVQNQTSFPAQTQTQYSPQGGMQNIAQTNGQAMGSGAGDSSNSIRIFADRDTNSLIINAPEAVKMRMLDILREIDREPVQVFIEASILEVTLTKDFNFGVDWSKLASKGRLTLSNYGDASTSFSSIAPGASVNYVGSEISAAITALSSESKVKILSAPKISTVENATADLEIGDQVPVITQTSQSTAASNAPLVSSVTYLDTGVLLKVTPHVSSQNRITLDISQEVSSVSKTVTSGIDSPTINKRQMQSKIIVPEGEVVALGGLISSEIDESNSGMPLVKDIPLIGNLFKGQNKTGTRTEMVVLIQAKIIRDHSYYKDLMANLNDDLKDLQNRGAFDKIP